MGLQGMINDMLKHSDFDLAADISDELNAIRVGDWRTLARVITALENDTLGANQRRKLVDTAQSLAKAIPVVGVTGTGGSGKSSLTDELVLRFRLDYDDDLKIGIIAIDPSRRKTGGALLGAYIRWWRWCDCCR